MSKPNQVLGLEMSTVDEGFFKDTFSLRSLRRTQRSIAEGAITPEQLAKTNKLLAEAITVADLTPQADVLDRRVIAGFRDFMASTPQYDLTRLLVEREVEDYRDFKDIIYSDIENYREKKAEEGYAATYIDVSEATHSMKVFGRLVHVTNRAWKNDREGILKNIPTLIGRAGKRTLMRQIAKSIGNAADRANLYSLANGNLFTLALTQANLETVLANLRLLQEPVSGEPRGTVMAYLVVPATLELVAERIVNPIRDTLAIQTIAGNIVQYKLEVISSPMLDTYTTTGWWLFAKPQDQQGPLVDAFVRGSREPEVFLRASDAQRISGGAGAEMGSFDTENITWKGRLVHNVHSLADFAWMTGFSDPTT